MSAPELHLIDLQKFPKLVTAGNTNLDDSDGELVREFLAWGNHLIQDSLVFYIMTIALGLSSGIVMMWLWQLVGLLIWFVSWLFLGTGFLLLWLIWAAIRFFTAFYDRITGEMQELASDERLELIQRLTNLIERWNQKRNSSMLLEDDNAIEKLRRARPDLMKLAAFFEDSLRGEKFGTADVLSSDDTHRVDDLLRRAESALR